MHTSGTLADNYSVPDSVLKFSDKCPDLMLICDHRWPHSTDEENKVREASSDHTVTLRSWPGIHTTEHSAENERLVTRGEWRGSASSSSEDFGVLGDLPNHPKAFSSARFCSH